MLARQGDFMRVAELLVNDGNYRGAEVIHPGWIGQMLRPTCGNPGYGSYLYRGTPGQGTEPYASGDVFVVEAEGGNRMWIVPSLQMAIRLPHHGEGWDDSRIPNLIIRSTCDFIPVRPHPETDLSKRVPGHQTALERGAGLAP